MTWNCIAYSEPIHHLYRRPVPVDRSSQAQNIQKLQKLYQSGALRSRQSAHEPTIPLNLPTLSPEAHAAAAAANEVSGNVLYEMRDGLSDFGGQLIEGFTDLTGLKLKEKPGFDLPMLPGKLCEELRMHFDVIYHIYIYIYIYISNQ